MNYLIRIIVDELEMASPNEKLSDFIFHYLWDHDAPGVTVRRGYKSISGQDVETSEIFEDQAFNDLPMIIETVLDEEAKNKIWPEITQFLRPNQAELFTGKREDEMSDYYDLKVFTKTGNKVFKKQTYERILDVFQKAGVEYATLTKGVAGFGLETRDGEHFRFARNEPIVIEGVVKGSELDDMLKVLKPMINNGVMFTTPIEIQAR